MADSFAVHLGGGAYLDASGKIVFGAPDNAQVYQVPGGFHLDTKKIQEAFKDLSGLLPADDDAKKKWLKWGVPTDVVNFLGKIAGAASIVATAISVYVWAIGVLITLMDIMTDDEGMSPELTKTLYSIKNQLQGLELIDRADKMIAMHAEFNGRIQRMAGLLTTLKIEKPVGAARAAKFTDMRAILDELAVPLSLVSNQEWSTTYNAEAYKGRAFASGLLVYQRSDGTTPPVPAVSPTITHFDYRLGVPMLLFVATTFASLAQTAMPWFRSAGIYARQLRETANAIDSFVLRMQNECLARTHYTPEIVLSERTWAVFEVPSVGGPSEWDEYFYPTYAVGAFDLVRYDDSFLVQRYVEQFQAGENTGPRGLFNYHWHTPLEGLSEIADAANEQAKQDYANLQVVTGMLRLVSTAAWLRFLSTPPDRSQTVSGSASDSRTYVDESPTTAKSPSIFPVGVIEFDAKLKRYKARNRVRITTQEPGYVPAFRYRIVLRTLRSQTGQEGWDHQDYVGDIWRADYEKTANDPRLNRLRTAFRENSILSQVVLHDGPSPTERKQISGEATVKASTFDWYVPVLSPWGVYVDQAKYADYATVAGAGGSKKKKVATGGVSVHLMDTSFLSLAKTPTAGIVSPSGLHGDVEPPVMQTMGGAGPLTTSVVDDFFDFDEVFAVPDASLDKAERRHVKTEDVNLSWQLDWKAERLEIRLFGQPENRPFQVHVVVEEIVYSGEAAPGNISDPLNDEDLIEHIHTPFVAEMVNQLVLVPEAFFDAERKAITEAAKMWREFLRRFAEERPIGPGDPIEYLEQSIRQMTIRSPSTATLAATLDQQVTFATREAPDLWKAVLESASRRGQR
jgi:hypothetical protein